MPALGVHPKSLWLLRLSIALCALATAHQYHRYSNICFSYLFIGFELRAEYCEGIVSLMVILLGLGVIALLGSRRWNLCFIALGAGVLLLEAWALTVYPPEAISVFNLPCHALRFLSPVALILLELKRQKPALKLLRWASSLTFFGHGAKALGEEMIFLDYLLAFFADIQYPISLGTGVLLLHVIGTIDIALAHHAMFFKAQRVLWIFRYMAIWGLITACARITFMGFGSWHETLSRAPHFIVPVVILLLLRKKI